MADSPKPPVETEAVLMTALADKDVPKLYANSFGLGLSNADIFIVFQRFGQNPVGVVSLSYTLAKTLAQRLGALVSEFESTIGGQPLLTTDKIDEAVAKRNAASDAVEPATTKETSDEVH